ncbi:hypothetical protein [Salinisphaera sp. G21_0]|uniref:hypothetical protein n=1 Tax=Salinisphaera sp. G21_0 TaxID=2821094 RepID=UPI001ADB2CFE|nr:hypothetical protein [Salinisphaera sp. G21_0]MBO9483786.1 hypothetical protein [Salinisphaera sp. G21_0]
MSDNWQARIENKLDQLTEVVVALAKHDERITNLSKRQDRTEERLDKTESLVDRNTIIAKAGQWVTACIVGGIVATVIRQVITTL